MSNSTSPVRFFFAHCGYSYDPKTETMTQGRWRAARALAKAERLAGELELKVTWAHEEGPWMEYAGDPEEEYREKFDSGEWEVWWACIKDDCGHTLASLGGIILAAAEWGVYTRVVEAELKMEAISALKGHEVRA